MHHRHAVDLSASRANVMQEGHMRRKLHRTMTTISKGLHRRRSFPAQSTLRYRARHSTFFRVGLSATRTYVSQLHSRSLSCRSSRMRLQSGIDTAGDVLAIDYSATALRISSSYELLSCSRCFKSR